MLTWKNIGNQHLTHGGYAKNKKRVGIMLEQLSLFPATEDEKIKNELYVLKEQLTNLRKGLFRRHDDLVKDLRKIEMDLTILKQHLKIEVEQKILEFPIFEKAEP